MTDILLLLLGAIVVNNFVLTQFLGVCPFMGVSGKLGAAVGMSIATTFVLTLSSLLAYLVHQYLLLPFDLDFLRTLSFILVIAAVVRLTELWMQRSAPLLYKVLGLFVPLIASNCIVLGVALLNVERAHSFVEAVFYGLGAALGFSLVLVLFAALRERLATSDVPLPFQGPAIALITAGLMSLAFMGFAGLA